jgi:hypothetical protein
MESPFSGLGKILMICGGVIILAGFLLYLGGKIPGLGRLPGDYVFKRGNVTVYLPLGTGLLLSIILSILFSIFSRR